MSITEIRRFIARRTDADLTIRPTATVAGPFPKRIDTADRMVCRSLDATSREVTRAQKRLV